MGIQPDFKLNSKTPNNMYGYLQRNLSNLSSKDGEDHRTIRFVLDGKAESDLSINSKPRIVLSRMPEYPHSIYGTIIEAEPAANERVKDSKDASSIEKKITQEDVILPKVNSKKSFRKMVPKLSDIFTSLNFSDSE